MILQALEHEKGGVLVYESALKCVINDDLKEEWEKYLEQTRSHVEAVTAICRSLEIDATKETPGRKVVRHLGEALVEAMRMARRSGTAEAAEIVACECVVIAETKDHLNWELIGKCARKLKGDSQDRSRKRTSRSKNRRTSICTIRRAGVESSGSSRWG